MKKPVTFALCAYLTACSYSATSHYSVATLENSARDHAGDYRLTPLPDVAPALQRAEARNRDAADRLTSPVPLQQTTGERYAPVTVAAAHGLEGVWRVAQPHGIAIDGDRKGQFGAIEEEICRFAAEGGQVHARCLGAEDFIGDRDVTFDGDRLSWSAGTPPFYSAHFEGWMEGATGFRGTEVLRIFGVMHFQDLPVLGQKLPLDPEREPELRRQLQTFLGQQRDLATLGALQSLAFADRLAPYNGDQPRAEIAVFDAEFEQGWRICAIGVSGQPASVTCR